MKKVILALLVAAPMFLFNQVGNAQSHHKKQAATADIVDVAVSSDQLTTLVAAVKAADLVATLKSDGPFTVLAPNNQAFGKIDGEALASLLKPENKSKLAAILTYHVLPVKLSKAEITGAIKTNGGKLSVTAVSGAKFQVSLSGDNIIITDAKGGKSSVIAADINASNGIVHIIDTVIMP